MILVSRTLYHIPSWAVQALEYPNEMDRQQEYTADELSALARFKDELAPGSDTRWDWPTRDTYGRDDIQHLMGTIHLAFYEVYRQEDSK